VFLRSVIVFPEFVIAPDIINGKGQYKEFDSTYESEPFFQQSLSFTHDRFTGSFQLNVGIHVTSAQLGVGYRLGGISGIALSVFADWSEERSQVIYGCVFGLFVFGCQRIR